MFLQGKTEARDGRLPLEARMIRTANGELEIELHLVQQHLRTRQSDPKRSANFLTRTKTMKAFSG